MAETPSPPDDPREPRPLLEPIYQTIACPWSPENPRNDHQLIFPLADGRLLLVWSEYYGNRPSMARVRQPGQDHQFNDHMPCRLSARISADRGRNWGPRFTIQDNTFPLNVKHPNLLRLPDGEILFFYSGWTSFGEQRDLLLKRSQDEGETWSPSRQISQPGWHCQNNDHVLRLSTGRILLPSHGGAGFTFSWGADAKPLYSFALISDDDGRTWRYSADSFTVPGRGAHEPSMVELNDGRVYCLMRTTQGRVYQSVSMDGGEHWAEPQPTTLPAPDSPPLVKRIPRTGDLLVVWNNVMSHRNLPRTPLSAGISRDEGKTWSRFVDLDQRPDGHAAYAAVTFLDDEVLVTYYSCRPGWSPDSEVALKIYQIDQFYR